MFTFAVWELQSLTDCRKAPGKAEIKNLNASNKWAAPQMTGGLGARW